MLRKNVVLVVLRLYVTVRMDMIRPRILRFIKHSLLGFKYITNFDGNYLNMTS